MKHRVKVQVPIEKRGLFGRKKIVTETRVIEVDDKTYKRLKQEDDHPYSIEEMMFYDDLLGEG